MFQYAAAYALARRNDAKLRVELSNFLYPRSRHHFELWRFPNTQLRPITLRESIQGAVLNRLSARFRRPPTYNRQGLGFDEQVLTLPDGSRISGYFQSERYFSDCATEIRDIYRLAPFVPDDGQCLRRVSEGRALCAIHVRRGDYVGNKLFYIELREYYSSAIALLSRATGCKFVVFSDDLAWCKQQQVFQDQQIHFSSELVCGAKSPIAEMALMSLCDHNIIANSTFSWWAAWLGDRPGKIIVMPRRWLSGYSAAECGLLVPSWTQL